MDKFFSIFGKIILVILVVGALVGAGAYFGKKYMSSPKENTNVPSQQTVSTSSPVAEGTTVPSPVQTKSVHVAITAGGVKPFNAYLMSGFSSWQTTHDTSMGDKLTITQGDYQITIIQGAIGGGPCSFPGTTPMPMSVMLTSSTNIELLSGDILKRGQAESADLSKESFTVCQKKSDGNYSTLTDFGAINYTTPLNPDSDIIAQMDAMIGSLQKQ